MITDLTILAIIVRGAIRAPMWHERIYRPTTKFDLNLTTHERAVYRP